VEVLSFVRAVLPMLLSWDMPSAPTFGFGVVFERCGLEPEELSWAAKLWRELHHSKNTVILDQVSTARWIVPHLSKICRVSVDLR
ncbi:MAG: hypothetical protein SGPRY_013148, partial [Prymnesium sp.]